MFYTLKRPLITEKNSMMAEDGVYVFEVDKTATKAEIKSSVEKYFRVKVDSVRTSVCRGRARRNPFGSWSSEVLEKSYGETKRRRKD
jgi:large subunit ribosomal protein L23